MPSAHRATSPTSSLHAATASPLHPVMAYSTSLFCNCSIRSGTTQKSSSATQLTRAMDELRIQFILVLSLQPKRRVDRIGNTSPRTACRRTEYHRKVQHSTEATRVLQAFLPLLRRAVRDASPSTGSCALSAGPSSQRGPPTCFCHKKPAPSTTEGGAEGGVHPEHSQGVEDDQNLVGKYPGGQ